MAYTKSYKKKSPFKKTAPIGRFMKKSPRYLSKGLTTAGKVAALSRDIAILKGLTSSVMAGLNTEKKFKDADVLTSAVGQTFGTLSGWNGMDVTPVITQGTDSDERVGNSLKLTGMSIPIQFSAQERCLSGRKLKVMLFRVHDANNNVSITDCIQDYLDPNPLNGLHDMGSPVAYRAGKHDGIKLIRSKVYNLPSPTIVSSGNTMLLDTYEKSGFTCKFNVKFNDVLRYGNSADDKPDGTRYYLYVMCDKGNHHPTVATTQDVPVPAIQSGVSIRVSQRSWWVDN
jgi:hypothetical protein